MKWIKLGTWLEWLIDLITWGRGELIARYVAKKLFDSDSCGCCERKQWLNRLTNKDYNGNCGMIKL